MPPPSSFTTLGRLPADGPTEAAGAFSRPTDEAGVIARSDARRWFLLAVGSLVLAGLLSLGLVIGRLPVISSLIGDPLFFKRALIVHVDLALVVWFQACAATFIGLGLGHRISRPLTAVALAFGVAGIIGLLAGGMIPGTAPVLSNYVPVIDHPIYLAGLASWFIGAGLYFAGALRAARPAGNDLLPDEALVGLRATAAANLLGLVTFAVAWRTTPSALPAAGFYELVFWGGGHVLQVANVAAMLAMWLFLLGRWSGRAVLSPAASRWLFAGLIAPHGALPLLAAAGTVDSGYLGAATDLMRWTIFPVVLIVLGLGLRHIAHHRRSLATVTAWWRDHRLVGFGGSALLTVLGIVLGACIRQSSTLVPGHYHAAIGAVTFAFMAAAYELCRDISTEAAAARAARRARLQLLLFGGGQTVFALGFSLAGAYGLGRKQYSSEQHIRSAGEYLGLGVMGLGGLVAVAGGLLFLALMLRCLRAARPQPRSLPS